MEPRKRSFFERLTGSIRVPDEEPEQIRTTTIKGDKKPGGWMAEESEEAELAVDVYQTGTDIIVQTMVAGVKPEEFDATERHGLLTVRVQKVDKEKKNSVRVKSI